MECLVTAWLWGWQLTYVYTVTLTVAIKDSVRSQFSRPQKFSCDEILHHEIIYITTLLMYTDFLIQTKRD